MPSCSYVQGKNEGLSRFIRTVFASAAIKRVLRVQGKSNLSPILTYGDEYLIYWRKSCSILHMPEWLKRCISITVWAGNEGEPVQNELSTWPAEPVGDFDLYEVK